tara:strand:+ start:165 stop:536 length:372 start_codon:yes stop_codon:yes gene_type:complete
MKQLINKLFKWLGYIEIKELKSNFIKPQSFRFYIQPKEGKDWIQIVVSNALVKGKLHQVIDAKEQHKDGMCKIDELAIYAGSIKLEKCPIDRSTEQNLTHWYRMGDGEEMEDIADWTGLIDEV